MSGVWGAGSPRLGRLSHSLKKWVLSNLCFSPLFSLLCLPPRCPDNPPVSSLLPSGTLTLGPPRDVFLLWSCLSHCPSCQRPFLSLHKSITFCYQCLYRRGSDVSCGGLRNGGGWQTLEPLPSLHCLPSGRGSGTSIQKEQLLNRPLMPVSCLREGQERE